MARSLSMLGIQLVLLTVCVCSFTFGFKDDVSDAASVSRTGVSISPRKQVQYTRTEEVKANCPALTPRVPQPDKHAAHVNLKRRLSFQFGNWEESDFISTPIVPFLQWNESTLPATTKLASLTVTDVSKSQMLKGTFVLTIIDGKSPFVKSSPLEASFTEEPGLSVLTIEVEGIYQETQNEDVICMLGCTFLPSPDGGVSFPNIQNSLGTKKLEKNCDIKLQLNYPTTFNLTSQIVRGTIYSLVTNGGRYNFAPISFSSQFQSVLPYEAAPAEFVKEACPADASWESDSTLSAYKASLEEFCALTNGYIRNSLMEVEPNWMCNGTTQNCGTIGPFSSYPEGTAYHEDYNTSRARILVTSSRSSPCHFLDTEADEVPFSLVFRLIPSSEDESIARRRSGLDGHTLVAEGYWTNRSSTLCMIACKLDGTSGQTDNCNFRVTLHIPLYISITQRNVYKGSISSLLSEPSFFPLTFNAKLEVNNRNLPYQYMSSLQYNYSMLEPARAILDRSEPDSRVKISWFKYPSLIGEEVGHYQSLADDLTLQHSLKGSRWTSVTFQLEAVDKFLPFVRTGFIETQDEVGPVNDTILTKTEPTPSRRQETRKYMNCSGTLQFLGDFVNNEVQKLTISTEGLYNPLDGKMYMMGCRAVKGSWGQISDASYDLVDGMDCEIEVVLEYPTTLSAWLLNPGVKVKVHSNRPATNIFHFEDIDTETHPILYRGQREQMISRNSFEAAISVVALSLTLLCIITQLVYIGHHEVSTPYISLSMLLAQALGYAIPLITGARSLLARKFDYREDYFFQESGSVQMIIYVDKILTLVALLLFLRLFEKSWRERRSLSELGDAANVPRERSVVTICLIIHAVGFVSVMGLHSLHPRTTIELTPIVGNDGYVRNGGWDGENAFDRIRRGPMWRVSQEYTGLIEDLFLLPQVIGFSLWDVTGKPLRKSFFVGLTLLQIVPHVYDYLRSAHVPFYRSPIYANPDFDFYTDVGNILIPALALILALLVYCQQRWKGFLRLPRRFLYRQLGTKSSETELVSTNGRNYLPPIPECDDE